MKRYVLAFGLCSLVWAQEGVKFGIRFMPAIGFSNVDSAGKQLKALSPKGLFALGGGLMLSFGFSDNAALLVGAGIGSRGLNFSYEAGYGLKGKRASGADTTLNIGQPVNAKVRLTNIDVPIWIKMRTNDLVGGLRVKALLGGTTNIAVGASLTGDQKVFSADFIDDGKSKVLNQVSVFNASADAGAGIDWEIEGVGTLDVTFLFSYGLINIYNKDFKFEITDSNGQPIISDIRPYRNLKSRIMNLGLNLIFWF
ncbi:MAG: outer membrane beta-barrel protein [Bacteroidia bacterium]